MARTDNFKNFATDVADSIRSMTGKTGKIPASQFDTEIKSIETKEDLDEELNTYNTEVTEQGVSIDTIINLLQGKGKHDYNYSTEEKVIGKWIDNKPLYRKTFTSVSELAEGTAYQFSLDHGIANVETIFLSGESFLRDGSGETYEINCANITSSSSIYIIKSQVNITTISTRATAGLLSAGEVTEQVTICYTKTTDTATDEELGTTNYSTDEQEVGTNVDGLVLYQKTIVANALKFTSNGGNITNSISHNIENVKDIYIMPESFLYCTYYSGTNRNMLQVNMNNHESTPNRQYIRTTVTPTYIKQTVGDWIFSGSNNIYTRVTLRYTKNA